MLALIVSDGFGQTVIQLIGYIGTGWFMAYGLASVNALFVRLHSKNARTNLMITGLIGVSVLELSHVLMCEVFRHRIESPIVSL